MSWAMQISSWLSPAPAQVSLMLVCAANICRSPMAAQVLRHMAERPSLGPAPGSSASPTRGKLKIVSAGVQTLPRAVPLDPRAQAALLRRGYGPSVGRSRQLELADFERFDLLLAMDGEVLARMREACPQAQAHKLQRFLDYAPSHEGQDMPDPYWGDARGFEHVLDLCEAAAGGLLAALARGEVLGPAPQ